jgi:site-specific DNA-methyltransferase (adenine-specific)
MPKMPDQSVDAIISDLPYGTTACKWDSVIPFAPLWQEFKRILKSNGVIILTSSQPFTTDLINSNRADFKYELIWEKSRPSGIAQAKSRPMKIHESILVFSCAKTTFNPIKEKRQYKGSESNRGVWKTWNTGSSHGLKMSSKKTFTPERNPTSILKFPSLCPFPKGNILHPTQKPTELMRYLVRTYTNRGDVVLDPCCGSGTTCLAAMLEGRKSIGIEKDEQYAKIAINRIHEARGLGV